jgi:DNA-binding transcriptional MerR regulator
MSMRSEQVGQMSIGEFARRSRLSAKALRLYDELGLLPPARVDADSGYRLYEPDQLKQALLIAALRQLQVPLAEIKAILPLEPVQAAERVREFWAATEVEHTSRRALAAYLIDELSGRRSATYEVNTRDIPARSVLSVKRNVQGVDAAWAFGKEFIALLRHHQLPQIPGRAGAFFCIFWGEVSEDSDGPMEWCRRYPAPPRLHRSSPHTGLGTSSWWSHMPPSGAPVGRADMNRIAPLRIVHPRNNQAAAVPRGTQHLDCRVPRTSARRARDPKARPRRPRW